MGEKLPMSTEGAAPSLCSHGPLCPLTRRILATWRSQAGGRIKYLYEVWRAGGLGGRKRG